MENVPYYDFSTFPVTNDILLKLIDSAVNSGIKMIFINFGDSFPWSLDKIITSEFAYPEKLIEKIVNICRHHDIILVPVLSILIDSDFILRDGRYNYLINEDRNLTGLDPSASGAGKFIEEVIDDIYSILMYSENLLIEIPSEELMESDLVNDVKFLIRRLSETLRENGKNLIFGCDPFCDSLKINELLDGMSVSYKIPEEELKIYNGNSYCLDIITEKLIIKNVEYRLFRLNGNDGFNGAFDSGYIASIYHTSDMREISEAVEFEIIDSFFCQLDDVWSWIRKSRENLCLIYRNKDQIYRRKFLRAFSRLHDANAILTRNSVEIIESLEKQYQPGVLRHWINSKMDPVIIQLNDLDFTAKQIGEGN